MKKEYFANKDFNRLKRKKAVTLSVVLVFIILSMSALFAASNDYVFTFVFLSFILIPIIPPVIPDIMPAISIIIVYILNIKPRESK